MRVPCWAGRCGPIGAASHVCGGVFLASARGGLGHWGVSHTPHEGAAESTEDLVHKGCVCFFGFRLRTDGRLQLPAHRQRLDLVDRGNGAQLCRGRGSPPSARAGGSPPVAAGRPGGTSTSPSIPWCASSGADPPPEAVEGMARVPGAGFPRQNGRQGVWGLIPGQGGGAVRQGCSRQQHGVDGFQVRVALLRVRGDPHLVVVATFQNDHGDGAGVIFAWRGSCVCRLRFWWVPLHQIPEVTPLVGGRPAFPFCQAVVQWDVGGIGCRLLGVGLGSVGGAMSVCAQLRCRTHTHPWSGSLVLNHQIHVSTRSSAICIPGATSAWSCRTEMSVDAACGRGTTVKSLFGLTSWRCSRRAA